MFGVDQGVVLGVCDAGYDIATHGCDGGGGELDRLDLADGGSDTDDPDEFFCQDYNLFSALIGWEGALLALIIFFVEVEAADVGDIFQFGARDGREFGKGVEGEEAGG